jgi:DNA-binding NarL/FixJ family response regulator
MGNGVPWSADEDQRLRRLAQAGLGAREIAVKMNRTPRAIREHARKINIAIARSQNRVTKVRWLRPQIELKAKQK